MRNLAMSGSAQPPQLPPAGWYSNPEGLGLRWWDGSRWTDYLHMQEGSQMPHRSTESGDGRSTGLYAAGLLTAFFIPLVGFIIGAVLYGRPQQRNAGMIVMTISFAVLAFILYTVAG
jgi:hypothetical protein